MATVDEVLAPHTPEVRELSYQAMNLVKSLVPDAIEKVYMGWKGIGYHHPTHGYFCAVFPQGDHTRLAFEHGVDLHDPDGLLQGNGKQVRYIPIYAQAELEQEAVSVLILTAAG